MSIIDHLGVTFADYARALRFYEATLAPLGIGIVMQVTKEQTGGFEGTGFGRNGKPEFWVSNGGRITPHMHVAFATESRAEVNAFFEAALAAGGADNGAPGVRAQYHPHYYGAFVLDPEGHNIEAVCHKPG